MAAWYIHNAAIIFQICLFPTVFGNPPPKNPSHNCRSPTVFGHYLLLPRPGESKMYKLLEHMELYYTGILIIVLAISVPWC